jgi:hypothetical protein
MTAIDTPAPARTHSAAHRWANVMRMHAANPWPTLITPWLIFAAVFGLNYAIWRIIIASAGGRENLDLDAFVYNGGVTWILIFMMVVAVQAMNLTFQFALGFSVTRRDYYLGTVAYFVALSVFYTAGITAMAALERATDGWGVGGYFFAPFGLYDLPLWQVSVVFLAMFLLFFFLGSAVATVWVRWRATGLYIFFLTLAALLVAAVWIVASADAWGSVWGFFSGNSALENVSWTLVLTAASALSAYVMLRRATARG